MSKKNEDYNKFVDKFKPKKTTDDCYTPPLVYDAVLRWARKCLDIEDRPVVRPFFPGGDYVHYDYPDNCVVIESLAQASSCQTKPPPRNWQPRNWQPRNWNYLRKVRG